MWIAAMGACPSKQALWNFEIWVGKGFNVDH